MTFNKTLKKNGAAKAKKRKKIIRIASSLFRLFFLIAVSYIVIYPLLYMIISSISTEESFLTSRRIWIPSFVTTAYFHLAAKITGYARGLLSTLTNEVVAAVIEVCSCAVAAYGFSRFNFRFKKLFTGMLFLTILIPTSMIIIPLSVNYSHLDVLGVFGLIKKLSGVDLRINILNSSWSFWLPSLFAMGLRSGIMIFIYMQFFKGLPTEFEEAAYVDGAGPLRTFLQIIIPSSSVVILTVSVFSIIWHWNDYQMATMFMDANQPLSVGLLGLPDLLQTYGYWISENDPKAISILMAACVMFVLPVLVCYLFVQHWFIESVDRVGITG